MKHFYHSYTLYPKSIFAIFYVVWSTIISIVPFCDLEPERTHIFNPEPGTDIIFKVITCVDKYGQCSGFGLFKFEAGWFLLRMKIWGYGRDGGNICTTKENGLCLTW